MKIADSITDLIGNTPLVRINRLARGCAGEVVGKLEFQNPCGERYLSTPLFAGLGD